MSPEDFIQFLKEGQNMEDNEDQLSNLQSNIFSLYGTSVKLNFEGFLAFLTSRHNEILTFSMTPHQITHDMTQPLHHYFIASSHNTYLLGDQLKSRSSAQQYAKVLKTGCRCVELDAWDGSNGEPEIYHGHTLTTSISFESAVQAIKENAFIISPYPVILSLETHCSISQQEKMAKILIETLGDLLYYPLTEKVFFLS